MLYASWLLLHLLGVIVWVGGMFFAYFCLRPAAASTLDPAQRLPLWNSTFARFLRYAALAVVAILVSGSAMLAQVGMRNAPLGWHVMLGLGLLMSLVFVYVYAYLYPMLRSACQAADWPAAARALDRIRHMVAVNLGLSLLTVLAALLVR
jgi:uncharacterized membrane protein